MIKFISYGLGTIGLEILKVLLNNKNFKLVGAVDIKDELLNKDIGELIGYGKLNLYIKKDIKEFEKCDIVIHSTGSRISDTFEQFKFLLSNGYNIISTCEELFYPYYFHKKEAEELNKIAKENGVRILGTGINPGFILDTLVVFITTLSTQIEKISAERVLDASKRRKQLQIKIGSGLTVEEFNKLKNENKIGHVGLLESLFFIFDTLNLEILEFNEILEPLIAEEDIKTEYLEVKKGLVRGQYQKVQGISKDGKVIELILIMALNEKESFDRVKIFGKPNVELIIKNGIQGDLGTAAVVSNYIPILLSKEPGLYTTKDLNLPHILF
ncbi:MAG: hypothetical protein QMD25_04530 [Caldisericia bacterium]|jgi:4-hydroxy-tetrahydrodipicolinate reductase|nr:hypothetical protein [Caldisericia bacterium]